MPLGVGTQVGPFRITERLGIGGMGDVWAAEQTDPIERRVAMRELVVFLGGRAGFRTRCRRQDRASGRLDGCPEIVFFARWICHHLN